MTIRFFCVLALSLSATMLLAAPTAPKFQKGTPYAIARAALLSSGWSPVKATNPDCEPGREDVCAAYPEAQSCAGTGFGICTFDRFFGTKDRIHLYRCKWRPLRVSAEFFRPEASEGGS
jgi:hypothetical protein